MEDCENITAARFNSAIKACLEGLTRPSAGQNQAEVEGSTSGGHGIRDLDPKDASWILTSALIIFTMQTGTPSLQASKLSRFLY